MAAGYSGKDWNRSGGSVLTLEKLFATQEAKRLIRNYGIVAARDALADGTISAEHKAAIIDLEHIIDRYAKENSETDKYLAINRRQLLEKDTKYFQTLLQLMSESDSSSPDETPEFVVARNRAARFLVALAYIDQDMREAQIPFYSSIRKALHETFMSEHTNIPQEILKNRYDIKRPEDYALPNYARISIEKFYRDVVLLDKLSTSNDLLKDVYEGFAVRQLESLDTTVYSDILKSETPDVRAMFLLHLNKAYDAAESAGLKFEPKHKLKLDDNQKAALRMIATEYKTAD